MEDKELIRRIQNGQKEYLNEIAEKYYDDIYYFCCYQTGSREDAYDLTQETFLRFIRYVEKYRYRNLKGYLLTIAMNLCREYMRERGEVRQRLEAADNQDLDTLEDRKSRETMDRAENSVLLSEALMRLTDIQREALILHYLCGYKNREIARMTGAGFGGCTVSLVKDEAIDTFINKVGEAYRRKIGYKADFYVVEVGDGPCTL